MSRRGQITELSLYPAIKREFEDRGAEVVTEPKFITRPDFIVKWLGEKWIVSVKIGDPMQPRILREAFVQYVSHMKDTGIGYGMIIFYPKEIRRVELTEEAIKRAVRETVAYFIVLNPQMELRRMLPQALTEIERVLREKIPVSFSLETVITLLRGQIEDLMDKVNLSERQVMKLVSSPDLFFGINPIENIEKDERKRKEALRKASTFLAAYIFLSQVLFLRLYCDERPTFLEEINIESITRENARRLFDRVRKINYRPIFEIDVLDYIPGALIRDTFRLLFGLQIRRIRYELPGRLFHELMPREIRKLLAAFYTRPIAAYLLTLLTIDDANATVFDPACGSGTILTMTYRRKRELWKKSGCSGNLHKLFCEKQIYGCDIMPFAVHLTNANLAAMDPLTTIDLTQIALGDSLKLAPSTKVRAGFITLLDFMSGSEKEKGVRARAFKRTGETIEITLKPVKVVLMNPPFTKVERGIKKYIDTGKFENAVGREVGLWGHFIALADAFLEEEGVFGAVLPINLLRGRESARVREIIFRKWFPLYVIKAALNYGFSEYAEYRDVLVIAKKNHKKRRNHVVKFCIVKKDLNKLTDNEVRWIAEQIRSVVSLRSKLLDIDSYSLSKVLKCFNNMMPFISGPSFECKDALYRIIEEAKTLFHGFPSNYFKEGYGPRPRGASGFMFITNPISEGRIREAFLILEKDSGDKIVVRTPIGAQRILLDKKHFIPCLRTPVGLNKMDVTKAHDLVAKEPYENISRVMELCGFKEKLPSDYWNRYIRTEFERSTGRLAVIRRINPYSPNQMLTAYYSDISLVLANVFHVVDEEDSKRAKSIAVLLNSVFFLAYFFNVKEETTGRYTELRHYDLYEMKLYPTDKQIRFLANVYEKYKNKEFPSLREQLDIYFNHRYNSFWMRERKGQENRLPPPVKPHPLRLEFDMDVIKAVGANLKREDLIRAYEAIVWDMIVTRGLRKD